MKESGVKIITENRKARHDFTIIEVFEAGIELKGTEVKSLRAGKVNLKDSFVRITARGEMVMMNTHISPYDFGNVNNHDPLRTRRLLMHRREIDRLLGKIKEKGLTLVPLKMYFKHGLVKVAVALAEGKKVYDKRRDIAKKDANREIQRALKDRQRY